MMLSNMLINILIYAIPTLFAITLHEFAHGYMAYKNGDDTAFLLGRLTTNPFKHIDLLGTIVIPFTCLLSTSQIGQIFLFGWAKPIPVNIFKFYNFRKGVLAVAIAGPLINFAQALFWLLVWKFLNFNSSHIVAFIHKVSFAGINVNLTLFIFNLIPILPLDGGRILYVLLPQKYAMHYASIERYGLIIIMLLLVLFSHTIVLYLYNPLLNMLLSLVG